MGVCVLTSACVVFIAFNEHDPNTADGVVFILIESTAFTDVLFQNDVLHRKTVKLLVRAFAIPIGREFDLRAVRLLTALDGGCACTGRSESGESGQNSVKVHVDRVVFSF